MYKRNPLAQPSERIGMSFHKDRAPGVVEVYLYDREDLEKSPEEAMVAGIMVAYTGDEPRWESSGVAACQGYGPLIYDLAASLLRQTVFPTTDQTDAAKAFWARQPQPYIDPLSPEEFQAKYGLTVQDLYNQGVDLEPDELQRMSDQLVETFFGAREAEARGQPIRLPRDLSQIF